MLYDQIIEDWVREFIMTMDHPDDLYPGNASGDFPTGVKIIFDGYGEDADTGEETRSMMSFAVFVHQDSLESEFPPHEITPWALVHRPSEEACFYVWYNSDSDEVDCITDISELDTELDHDFVIDLIQSIYARDHDE